jgi:hypothetical protein
LNNETREYDIIREDILIPIQDAALKFFASGPTHASSKLIFLTAKLLDSNFYSAAYSRH